MPRNVDIDCDDGSLHCAASLLDELHRDFVQISNSTTDIMAQMTKACGDDHFGHKFTDGEKGFRTNCESAEHGTGAISESFRQYAEKIGGETGVKALFNRTEQASAENIRRTV
ncbi:hypothetical protein AB4305_02950 [Nocardia sp. 2YAB30]|uniref:hypothetical protein n=1 Tax=unclassified Nocardia TaxID=2637762 RepID=UPI003F97178A